MTESRYVSKTRQGNARIRNVGFTAAELAAAEWNADFREKERRRNDTAARRLRSYYDPRESNGAYSTSKLGGLPEGRIGGISVREESYSCSGRSSSSATESVSALSDSLTGASAACLASHASRPCIEETSAHIFRSNSEHRQRSHLRYSVCTSHRRRGSSGDGGSGGNDDEKHTAVSGNAGEENKLSKCKRIKRDESEEEENELDEIKISQGKQRLKHKKLKKLKKESKQSRKKRRKKELRHGRSRSRSPPQDPRNPLMDAHDSRLAVRRITGRRKESKRSRSRERYWNHDKYVLRSPSPCRERTDGSMWNTRNNSWKSRAGGVYIPPVELDAEGNASPARYRVPPPERERRDSRSRSSRSLLRSSERNYRGSPVYTLDD